MSFFKKAAVISLLLAVTSSSQAYGASNALDKSLQGPKFSNPEEAKMLVKQEWKQKRVSYSKTAGNPDLIVSLDQHFYPAAKPVIEAYAKAHGLNITLKEGTCGSSSGLAATKMADMTGYCCPPALSDRLPGLVFHTIGVIPNVLITPHGNPVKNLTLNEAQQVFSGDISFWSELSDKKAKAFDYQLNPITRLHCKIRPGHWRTLLDNEDLHSPMIHNVGSIPDMKDNVASNPHSVGFIARWQMTATELKRLNILTLNGVHPDDPGVVAKGSYPLYNVLNVTTWSGAASNAEAEKLIDHLLEKQEQYDPAMYIVPANHLRAAGWRFKGNELIGEPDS
jgi:phosphate transport system substrate-binding protein